MMKNKYPLARPLLDSITLSRMKLSILTQCDALLEKEELESEVHAVKQKLENAIRRLSNALESFVNPADALLLRILYIYGVDKAVAKTGTGMSPSGFYTKLDRSIKILDQILAAEASNE